MTFKGIIPPAITPYLADGSIDYKGLATVLEHLIAAGVHGIIIGGTTGEYYAQSREERISLLKKAKEIIGTGLLTKAQWDAVSAKALALFARGQKMAAERGLILVDTKYEFGTDAEGNILLADEIHTPDSSRYWIAEGYRKAFESGDRPPSFDKDVIRSWVVARCDPYKDKVPDIPPDMIEKTALVYIEAFEAITGQAFVPDTSGATPLDRIRANLTPFFTT